jgi:hypothetical protein
VGLVVAGFLLVMTQALHDQRSFQRLMLMLKKPCSTLLKSCWTYIPAGSLSTKQQCKPTELMLNTDPYQLSTCTDPKLSLSLLLLLVVYVCLSLCLQGCYQ